MEVTALKTNKQKHSWVVRAGTLVSGFSHYSSKRLEKGSSSVELTIKPSHPSVIQPTCLPPHPAPLPTSYVLSAESDDGDQTLDTTEKRISLIHPTSAFEIPLSGDGKSKCAGGKTEAPSKAEAYGKARHGHPHFAVPASEDSETLPGLPRSPRSPGPRGARADFRLPLSAAAAGSARGLGAPLPTPGRPPRASRTLRGCSPGPR